MSPLKHNSHNCSTLSDRDPPTPVSPSAMLKESHRGTLLRMIQKTKLFSTMACRLAMLKESHRGTLLRMIQKTKLFSTMACRLVIGDCNLYGVVDVYHLPPSFSSLFPPSAFLLPLSPLSFQLLFPYHLPLFLSGSNRQ